MIPVHNGTVTLNARGKATLGAQYDPALQMTRVTLSVGDSVLEAWVPMIQLADLLSEALEAAGNDSGAIGYDAYTTRTNTRLAHIAKAGA